MNITAVIATIGCPDLHLTETKVISPTLMPDSRVDGLLGSSADFCQVCEKSGCEIMQYEARVIEVTDDLEADLYSLRRV